MNGKFRLNKKSALGIGACVMCVAFIALCSFFPFIIDPSQWQTAEFLSDELIVVAITVFGIVAFVFIAQSQNAGDARSNLAMARKDFAESVKRITDVSAFGEWVRDVLQPRDVFQEKKALLQRIGIEDPSILELDIEEIKSLTETREINGRKWKALEKDQIKEVLKIKRKSPIKKLVDPTYYLIADKGQPAGTISKQSGHEDGRKTALLSWSLISKSVVTVLVAIITASLVFDASSDEITQATAWLKFTQRMMTLASSAFMGYIVGCQTNDIDAYYIRLRIEAHNEYIDDKARKGLK